MRTRDELKGSGILRLAGARSVFALAAAAVLAGACAASVDGDEDAELRRAFPEASRHPLDEGAAFAAKSGGVAVAEKAGEVRLGVEIGEGGVVVIRDGTSGVDVTLREIGASGAPERGERGASYRRERGRAYWSADASGAEEWLAVAAPASGPIASWRVDGAKLHPRGAAVDLLDETGTERLRISAPEAFGEGERRLPARLAATGTTLELFVDGARPGERLLVDPKYMPAWIVAASLNPSRVLRAMTTLPDGEVAVFNGYEGNAPVTQCQVYDPGSNRWRVPFAMTQNRASPGVVTLADGRVMVVGGNDGSGFINGTAGVILKSVEISDPLGDVAPVSVAPLTVGRELHTATLLPDGRVLVVGGYNGASIITSFEVYNPIANVWTSGSTAGGQFVEHTATLLGNGDVLLVGPTSGIFDPASNTVTAAAASPKPSVLHAASLLLDGRVLVTGGSTGGTDPPFANVRIYDPSDDTWTVAPSMSTARMQHASTRLADGRILVTGGLAAASGPGLVTTEIYDPGTNAWTAGPSMTQGRFAHSAALLPTGQVIVVAGGNLSVNGGIPNTAALASVELYSPYLRAPGEPCGTGLACGTGFCVEGVCCDTACNDSPCSVCAVSAGADVDGTCTTLDPEACKAHPCTGDGECASDHCVDGVCCDKKCDGKCETCTFVRGTCLPAPVGLDPHGDCVPEGGTAVVCGPTCDGKGGCTDSMVGITCKPATCMDETHAVAPVACVADVDAGLACPAVTPAVIDCAPFKCDPRAGTCKESCTTVRDCPTSYVCTPEGKCEKRPEEDAENATGCAIGSANGRPALPVGSGAAPVLVLAMLGLTRRRSRRPGFGAARAPSNRRRRQP